MALLPLLLTPLAPLLLVLRLPLPTLLRWLAKLLPRLATLPRLLAMPLPTLLRMLPRKCNLGLRAQGSGARGATFAPLFFAPIMAPDPGPRLRPPNRAPIFAIRPGAA